ncbi:hypothetical protein ABZV25_13465, partial [Micrococcus luteus]
MTQPTDIRRVRQPAAFAAAFLRLFGRLPRLLDLYCCQGGASKAGLADGTIDTVGTDHAPHTAETKQCEWTVAA